MPAAPIIITHRGMVTRASACPSPRASTIAASGPTALATSLAPWAKDSSAAETTSGRANSFFSDFLRFSSPSDWRRTTGTAKAQVSSPITAPMVSAVPSPILTTLDRPLSAR